MAQHFSLLSNPNADIRRTYLAHLWMYILTAPSMALILYSRFLAVKTYDAEAWVPALAAIVPASHLLAIFFTEAISRSNKTSWVVWPMMISNLMFLLLLAVPREVGWMFAISIILAQSLRAPIISAQSAIFRINYPSTGRSYALSIPLSLQMLTIALYSRGAGWLFDHDEDWVVPVFLVACCLGLTGSWLFRVVKVRPPQGSNGGGARPRRISILDQFRTLKRSRGFFWFQLSYMFFGAGFVAIEAVMPFYLAREFHTSHKEATMALLTAPMIATAVTYPFWGRILDRSNPLVTRTVINGLWSFTPLLLFWSTTIHGVYLAQLIQGLVYSGSTLIWWLGVNYFARADEVPEFMALHQTLTGVRGIITPFIGIWIGNAIGYRSSMLFWFALMMIGFLIMVREVWYERKHGKLKTFSEMEAGLDQAAAQAVETPAK